MHEAQAKSFLREVEKTAIGPLTVMGLGALSHLGANLAVKATHGTRLMRNVRAAGMARGVRRGIAGNPQGVGSRMTETWLGPELIAPEHAGAVIGKSVRAHTKGQRYRALKKLRKGVAMNPELQHTPIVQDIVGGVNRVLSRGVPRVGRERSASLLQKAAPYSLAPALALTEPSALVHGAVNVARKVVAESGPGKTFMRKKFIQGMTGKSSDKIKGLAGAEYVTGRLARDPIVSAQRILGSPQMPGGAKARLIDTLVSPAALDTQRLGAGLRGAQTAPKRLAGTAHTILGQKRSKGIARLVMRDPVGALPSARPAIIKPPAAPSLSMPKGIRI